MQAGRLRHRVIIQQFSQIQSPITGNIEKIWQDLVTVWAEVAPASVRDFIAAQAEQSEVTGRITIRYRDGITSKNRILFRGKIYNISGVLPDPDSGIEYLTLAVSEGVNDG